MAITTPNGFRIGACIKEIRGVRSVTLGLNNPVDDDDDDTREVSARTRTLLKRGVRRSAVAHQRPNAWL